MQKILPEGQTGLQGVPNAAQNLNFPPKNTLTTLYGCWGQKHTLTIMSADSWESQKVFTPDEFLLIFDFVFSSIPVRKSAWHSASPSPIWALTITTTKLALNSIFSPMPFLFWHPAKLEENKHYKWNAIRTPLGLGLAFSNEFKLFNKNPWFNWLMQCAVISWGWCMLFRYNPTL